MSVFNTPVKASPVQQFDPHRMPEAIKVEPPVNTRTFLFHATKPEIIIEGVGATDQERLADLKHKMAEKLKLGYSTERQQHGSHPHSNDTARIEAQQLAAEKGDKEAQKALDAKAARATPTLDPEALRTENELLAERLAKLEAQLELAQTHKSHKDHDKK